MIEKLFFGTTKQGEEVYKYTLTNNVSSLSILSFGATVQSFIVPSKKGDVDVVLGYDNLLSYETSNGHLGCSVGRNSNRIKDGKFTLLNKEYSLEKNDRNTNNLHGGSIGFSGKVYKVSDLNENENSITLSYFSKDLEDGFPGNLTCDIKYTLKGTSLIIEYFGKTDKHTLFNPTNHSYFNLGGNVLETSLFLDAKFYTPIDKNMSFTGEVLSVVGTPFDFTSPKMMGKDINCDDTQLKYMGGYDVNLCLNNFDNYAKVATAKNDNLTLNVYTDRPAIQLYTANGLTERVGKNNVVYSKHGGFCLETQALPDACNNSHFKSFVLAPNETFYSKTTYEFIKE